MKHRAEEERLPATGVFGIRTLTAFERSVRGQITIRLRIPSSPNGFGPAVRILIHRPVVNHPAREQIPRQEVTGGQNDEWSKYVTGIKAFFLEP
jgi:hypothetical protein